MRTFVFTTVNIMKLTKKAIENISRTARLKLAMDLGFSEVWIEKLLSKNKGNGPLTTAKALQIIREETGLTDAQILEETKEPVK